MYDPSVTATHVPAAIDSSNQSSFPVRRSDSHIHVLPHCTKTSSKLVGMSAGVGGSAVDTTAILPPEDSRTVQILPTSSFCWSAATNRQRGPIRLARALVVR